MLPNGLVLVAGGSGSGGSLASAELYDPAAGTWPATGPMATARYSHTATLLPNGKVLVTGGVGSGGLLASAELFDPAAGTWAPTTGAMATARYKHTATLLPNGQVLVAGGSSQAGEEGDVPLSEAELFDPAAGTWALTDTMIVAARVSHTATLLPNGKVLVAGGFGTPFEVVVTGGITPALLPPPVELSSAELYGPDDEDTVITISGRKYYDINANGVYDGGEEWNTADGRPLVMINITADGVDNTGSTVTDATGLWSFVLTVPEGETVDFTAWETLPGGYVQTGPLPGATPLAPRLVPREPVPSAERPGVRAGHHAANALRGAAPAGRCGKRGVLRGGRPHPAGDPRGGARSRNSP